MPDLNKLADEIRRELAVHLGGLAFRRTFGPQSEVTGLHLGEDLETWVLTPRDFKSDSNRLSGVAQRTGYWHHLVYRNGEAQQLAPSKPNEDRPGWRVHSLLSSPVPDRMHQAMVWLDQNDQSSDPVRHLYVPVFGIHSFWLVGQNADRIIIVFMPREIDGFGYQHFYSPQEFLQKLARLPIATMPPR